ncbi:MAG: VanZ family protein [Oscillospiraceae bacterium]|nr:VanZ family protein [Oscillospiraceae bacterium]
MRAAVRRRGDKLWACLFLALMILTVFMIWSFSMENLRDSDRTSNAALRIVEAVARQFKFLRRILDAARLTPYTIEQSFRKIAHFVEFGLFGMVTQGFIIAIRRFTGHNMVHGLSAGLLVAVVDETIQAMHDRGARFTDVLIDFGGVMFGSLLAWMAYALFHACVRARIQRNP